MVADDMNFSVNLISFHPVSRLQWAPTTAELTTATNVNVAASLLLGVFLG